MLKKVVWTFYYLWRHMQINDYHYIIGISSQEGIRSHLNDGSQVDIRVNAIGNSLIFVIVQDEVGRRHGECLKIDN